MFIFAQRVAEARKLRGLTLDAVGALCHKARGGIWDYENGRHMPGLRKFRELCIALDVSADYLLGLSDEVGR